MKYFTKEWYELGQGLDYTMCMRPIADKVYTDQDIAALYEKKLKERIESDRADHDCPPSRVEIDFDEFELDDFVTYDEASGVLKKPSSMDEVKRAYDEEFRRATEEFENRPPFDPTETIENFKQVYEGGLKFGYSRYPDWVRNEADIRLIALEYLPKSVFDRLKAEQKRNKAEFDRITRAARKALSAERKKLPQELVEKFGFHDGEVLSIERSGGDIVMTVRADGVPFEGETPFVRITFVGGKILECGDGIKIVDDASTGERGENSYCTWLYDELYKTADGIEAHMMFACGALEYLTISASDIIIEDNVKIQ